MDVSAEVATYRAALTAYAETRQEALLAREVVRRADAACDAAGSRAEEARGAVLAAAAGGIDPRVWHWQSQRTVRPWWKFWEMSKRLR